MDARELLHGLAPALIAELCQVSIYTARRWKRRGTVSPLGRRVLELVIAGELGAIARDWSGWRVINGKLFSPEGLHVTPGEIRAIPYRAAQVRALEHELREPAQRSLI